jgi:hypothetical protein
MKIELKFAAAAAVLAAGLAGATVASAAPVGPVSSEALAGAAPITDVAQGCGPGYSRGPYGRCRPNYGPRRGFYERRCFVRPTPYGPRRVCR